MTPLSPTNRPVGHLRESLTERAYHNFLNRSIYDGDSLTDWLQAKSEILSEIDLKLKDQKKNILVEGEVKGYTPEEIEIEVCDGELRVSGSHMETTTSKTDGKTESKSQRRYFYQSFSLPTAVNEDKIQVKLSKSGNLKLTLPKKAVTSVKKISAKSKAAPARPKRAGAGARPKTAKAKATGAAQQAAPVKKKSAVKRKRPGVAAKKAAVKTKAAGK
jgi:HSP20 family protein